MSITKYEYYKSKHLQTAILASQTMQLLIIQRAIPLPIYIQALFMVMLLN